MASPDSTELTTSTGADGSAQSASFPPFNAETFAPQLFWLVLTFTALYLIMSRVALPRIGDVIEERQERIQRDLDNAERLKEETEQAIAAYDQALADARANASSIASETREKVTAEIDAERARVEEELTAKLAEAEERISETRASALSNVDSIASDLGVAMVYRLLGESPS
ncbi:MAG: F0F1 ATP synthase subunit B, partial [Pseudomonadota bacterium]